MTAGRPASEDPSQRQLRLARGEGPSFRLAGNRPPPARPPAPRPEAGSWAGLPPGRASSYSSPAVNACQSKTGHQSLVLVHHPKLGSPSPLGRNLGRAAIPQSPSWCVPRWEIGSARQFAHPVPRYRASRLQRPRPCPGSPVRPASAPLRPRRRWAPNGMVGDGKLM